MVKNHSFRFRVTKSQFEQIKEQAKAKGYVTIAPYVRDLVLQKDGFFEARIIETNQLAKEILKRLQ